MAASFLSDWWPQGQWPEDINRIWFETQLRRYPNNFQRFRIWAFFVGNGVNPDEVQEYFLHAWGPHLDLPARNQLQWLTTKYKSRDAGFMSRYFYFDMIEKQLLHFDGSRVNNA